MRKIHAVAIAAILAAGQSGCTAKPEPGLTQWGTPCGDYGLTAKQCHARFTDYGQFLAQSGQGAAAPKPK